MFTKGKTVATIMATFTKTIKELENVVEVQENKIDALTAEQARINVDIKDASAEKAKAAKIAQRLKVLIED
jgi:hypothetical protein